MVAGYPSSTTKSVLIVLRAQQARPLRIYISFAITAQYTRTSPLTNRSAVARAFCSSTEHCRQVFSLPPIPKLPAEEVAEQ
eukprot:6209122-Pleurochrysis_carterae.AAC.2